MNGIKIEPEDIKVLERAYIDRKYIHKILERIALKQGAKILDIGCGCGGSTEIIQEYNGEYDVIGLDKICSRIQIANQRKREGINYFVGDAEHIEYEDNYFDLVFARMLFEVCDKVDEILDEMIRVVKKNGKDKLN